MELYPLSIAPFFMVQEVHKSLQIQSSEILKIFNGFVRIWYFFKIDC